MSIWRWFLSLIGKRPHSSSRTYEISEALQASLTSLSQHEGRPEDELLPDLLAAGLTQYVSKDGLWKRWLTLTAREQDVAALACLGYTNREIGARLQISHETVKVRLKSAMGKFEVHSRLDLRQMLREWDFGEWERR